MPPELRSPDDPAEWMRRAASNLARARAGLPAPEVLYADLCFDAQQAAEKTLKAVLVCRKIPFPKTHVIGELLSLIRHAGIEVPADLDGAARLTGYAVDTRYPGPAEEVSEADYREALALAERVVAWARSMLPKNGPTTPSR